MELIFKTEEDKYNFLMEKANRGEFITEREQNFLIQID